MQLVMQEEVLDYTPVSYTHPGEYPMSNMRKAYPTTLQEHVDTRSVHPVYICGQRGVKLRDKKHSITLDDARAVAEVISRA